MTAAELQSWLDERRMTRRSFGLALEVSQDRLRRWLSGQVRIPRHIEMAIRWLEHDECGPHQNVDWRNTDVDSGGVTHDRSA